MLQVFPLIWVQQAFFLLIICVGLSYKHCPHYYYNYCYYYDYYCYCYYYFCTKWLNQLLKWLRCPTLIDIHCISLLIKLNVMIISTINMTHNHFLPTEILIVRKLKILLWAVEHAFGCLYWSTLQQTRDSKGKFKIN